MLFPFFIFWYFAFLCFYFGCFFFWFAMFCFLFFITSWHLFLPPCNCFWYTYYIILFIKIKGVREIFYLLFIYWESYATFLIYKITLHRKFSDLFYVGIIIISAISFFIFFLSSLYWVFLCSSDSYKSLQ